MKKLLIFIGAIVLLVIINKLDYTPKGFELSRLDYSYRISDKNTGTLIICEGDYLALQSDFDSFYQSKDTLQFDKTHPKVKEMKKYTNNKLGLVVYVLSSDNIYRYVAIKPKPKEEQVYAEMLVNYKIYTEEEYKKLGINDWWWHKLSFR